MEQQPYENRRMRYERLHKEERIAKARERYSLNKELYREKAKLYRETHKEEVRERHRVYREKHKDDFKEDYTCVCGVVLSRGRDKARHERTHFHQTFLRLQQQDSNYEKTKHIEYQCICGVVLANKNGKTTHERTLIHQTFLRLQQEDSNSQTKSIDLCIPHTPK